MHRKKALAEAQAYLEETPTLVLTVTLWFCPVPPPLLGVDAEPGAVSQTTLSMCFLKPCNFSTWKVNLF